MEGVDQVNTRKPLKSAVQHLSDRSRWIARDLAMHLLSTKGEGVTMIKYLLSAIVLVGLQLAHAEEASVPSTTETPAVADTDGNSRAPASAKSFFETRTFEEMQQTLKAVMNDNDSSAHGG